MLDLQTSSVPSFMKSFVVRRMSATDDRAVTDPINSAVWRNSLNLTVPPRQ
jgi:hypothetical protein